MDFCVQLQYTQFDRWLDELFEGNQKKVPAEIIQQIKVWLESIRQDLANENGIEFPFEVEEADVESSLGDWSVGFVDAMFLNEEAWFAPEYEEQLVDLTLPIMVLAELMKKIHRWNLSVAMDS